MSIFEEIKERLKTAFGEEQAELLAEIILKTYEDFTRMIGFKELKEVVQQLVEAQKRTEESLNRLAEAQRRTEERLDAFEKATEENFKRVWEAIDRLTARVDQLALRVDQLAEAQRNTEERLNQLTARVDQLALRVDQLAEAQRRTEERLNQLTLRVDQLAEAQKKTEEELKALAKQVKSLAIRLDQTNKQLGGLANTIGYVLENEAMKALPRILKRNHKLNVQGRLKRGFVADKYGTYIEVNIFGEAVKNHTRYVIIGESKSQLSKNDVDNFIRKKLKRFEGVFERVFPLLVTHMISEPDVEDYAKSKGITVFYSYEF